MPAVGSESHLTHTITFDASGMYTGNVIPDLYRTLWFLRPRNPLEGKAITIL